MAIDVYKEWLGIPEGPRPPDAYALLRLVQFEDDVDKIRKNYKKLNGHVRKYATGQYQNESQDLLNELARAMLLLTDAERKLEYDRGLGREIDDRDATTGRRPMTAYLVDAGTLTAEQVKTAQEHADRTGLTVRDALVQMKLIDAETAARAYASELGLPYIDLDDLTPESAALDQLPRNTVRRHTCLPLFQDDERVLVACVDEPGTELEDEVRLRFGSSLRPVIATPASINAAIAKYYAPGMRDEAAANTKAKQKGGAKGGKAKAAPKPVSKMNEEEKAQHKQIGILLICWTFIGLAMLDTFVFGVYVWPGTFFANIPITAIVLGPPIAFGVYKSYFK